MYEVESRILQYMYGRGANKVLRVIRDGTEARCSDEDAFWYVHLAGDISGTQVWSALVNLTHKGFIIPTGRSPGNKLAYRLTTLDEQNDAEVNRVVEAAR